MRPTSLAVLGLGAIGASVAWGAKRAGGIRVIGHASHRGDAIRALKADAVDLLAERPEDAVREAELVVIAEPAGVALRLLGRMAPLLPAGALVTSAAALMGPVAQAAEGAGLASRWAASHPVGPRELGGFEAAGPDAMRGAVVYVSGTGAASEQAVTEVMDFWGGVLEAHPVRMTAADHDIRLAWLVHLPRVLAGALGAAYDQRGLSGVRWGHEAQETARPATDPVDLASAMLADREAMLAATDAFAAALAPIRAALAAGDASTLVQLLTSARRPGKEGQR